MTLKASKRRRHKFQKVNFWCLKNCFCFRKLYIKNIFRIFCSPVKFFFLYFLGVLKCSYSFFLKISPGGLSRPVECTFWCVQKATEVKACLCWVTKRFNIWDENGNRRKYRRLAKNQLLLCSCVMQFSLKFKNTFCFVITKQLRAATQNTSQFLGGLVKGISRNGISLQQR